MAILTDVKVPMSNGLFLVVPVQHSLTKHISIRYHFIREHVMEEIIELHFVPTDPQLADIFTKPLAKAVFIKLVNELGMVSLEK